MITYVSVPGTGANWAWHMPGDIGRALTDPWLIARGECYGVPHGMNYYWQGAQYPVALFPMRPSILAGVDEVVRIMLEQHPSGEFVLCGYSQGAVVVCMVWRYEILDPNGRLHHRLKDCLGVITYGNPMRAPGVAYGNLLAGKKIPGKLNGIVTGGVSGPANLKPSECVFPQGHPMAGKPAVIDFANEGDLYTHSPCGATPWDKETEVGHNQTMVYELVLDFTGGDVMAFLKEIIEIVTMPMTQLLPLFLAIWGGLKFLGSGTVPHGAYDPGPAIRYLDDLGKRKRVAA